ncbi:hypothetical protein BC332_20075 [Capsicum chinense]|nr:hypothetical protein BC332_20075 [Capsicum chinense]
MFRQGYTDSEFRRVVNGNPVAIRLRLGGENSERVDGDRKLRKDEEDQIGENDENQEENDNEEEEDNRENTGGDGNVNHQNSEHNGSGNQESEGDEGEEDTENDDNQEENADQEEDEEEYELVIEEDDNEEEQEEEEEEEVEDAKERKRRRATKKQKQQVSEQLSVTEYYVDYDADPLDVAILRSILDFKCHYGYSPHPPSLDLIYHIMTSVPDLEISREELREKIIAYKENFNKVRKLEGDNPQMDQPIDLEFFDLCMRIWGNQDDDDCLR